MEHFAKKPMVVARDLQKSYQISRGPKSKKVEALRGINFVAYEGDSIGVLGRNGSGKSTLLRLIGGGESASSGGIRVAHRPTLLGVSAALQTELSGLENARLGLLAMGIPIEQIDDLILDISKFADIGDAILRPMKTYSSGMSARLKFAISTSVRPEILLVDEALSTGDAAFSNRATERMQSMLAGTGTVFLVSHAAEVIQKNCNRAIWLHEGRVVADGSAESVTKSYRVWGNRMATGKTAEAGEIIKKIESFYQPPAFVFESELTAESSRRFRKEFISGLKMKRRGVDK